MYQYHEIEMTSQSYYVRIMHNNCDKDQTPVIAVIGGLRIRDKDQDQGN